MSKKELKKSGFVTLFFIALVGANLRAPITSVGPVIPEMTTELLLTPVMIGILTAIPLVCFSLLSALMPWISRFYGIEKLLPAALLLLTAGLFLRSSGTIIPLFVGSVFIGVAITIANVMVPAFIKARFPQKLGLVTAAYLVSMNLTSALAVGYSISLGRITGLGWRGSIGIWGVLALATLVGWVLAKSIKNGANAKKNNVKTSGIWKSGLAWQISIFMGLQSVVFYVFAAWLPAVLQDWGMEAEKAGWVLSYMQMGQVPMMLVGPLLADKMKTQTSLIWGTFILLTAGLLLIIFYKTQFVALASVLTGISVGLAFALANMFFVLRTKNIEDATALSGMAQSVGYLEAAFAPVIFGFLFTLTGSWFIPMASLLIASFLLLLTGLASAKNRFVKTSSATGLASEQ